MTYLIFQLFTSVSSHSLDGPAPDGMVLFSLIVVPSKISNREASTKAPSLSYCSRPDELVFALSRHLFVIVAHFLSTPFQASGSVFLIGQLEGLELLPFNSSQPKVFVLGIGVGGGCWQDRNHASGKFSRLGVNRKL